MGSSFFGRPKMGGSSSSSPTSSPAKRGKNKNGSDKPKQPQRGLGVAQLEKIRLHSELNCKSFNTYPSYHPSTNNDQMNASNDLYERTPIRYRDAQPHIATSWNPNYGILESQHFVEPNITRHFLHEDQRNKLGSGIQMNFETSDATEPDLELRLSL
ncbi:protein SPEAR3 isoform X2 [Brassica rapa]|uniref:protein SPEAR3 isoform X2 n=1 Tax=Brassica campestris TaxID=3711 RepID=UPI00142E210D|nr:protein SPEAR3 isoform X2 [Brassica rapa]